MMNRNILHIAIAALLMLVAVSCEKDDTLPIVPVEEITLSAVTGNILTKSVMGPEGMDGESKYHPVMWSSNDAIAVVNNGRIYKFVVSGESVNSTEGSFKLDLSSLPRDYKEGDFKPEKPIKAFYPYEGVKYDSIAQSISYNVPQKQNFRVISTPIGDGMTLTSTSFDQGAMPMAAYAASAYDTLNFRNLFGVLKLQVEGAPGEIVESIEVTSTNLLNGEANVIIGEGYGGVPDISIYLSEKEVKVKSSVENKKVTLVCGSDGQSITNVKDFLITLPPRTIDVGCLFRTSRGTFYKTISDHKEDDKAMVEGEVYLFPAFKTTDLSPAYMENGIYLGDGVVLPKSEDGSQTLVWAPVNCGYVAQLKDGGKILDRGFLYGKLYQWGRKDGQGYKDNSYEDETYPGDVSVMESGAPAADKFYYGWTVAAPQWPADTDPCPEGWRVPTGEELMSLLPGLSQNDYVTGLLSHWTSSNPDKKSEHYGLPGFFFYGNTTETTGNKVFLPAAGFRTFDFAGAHVRGLSGCYWSSSANGADGAWYMDFNRKGYIDTYYAHQANGRSVRCVMESDYRN